MAVCVLKWFKWTCISSNSSCVQKITITLQDVRCFQATSIVLLKNGGFLNHFYYNSHRDILRVVITLLKAECGGKNSQNEPPSLWNNTILPEYNTLFRGHACRNIPLKKEKKKKNGSFLSSPGLSKLHMLEHKIRAALLLLHLKKKSC